MKTVVTYFLIALFTMAFSYKTVKYLTKLKVAETSCACEMDCENEKEGAVEKDEITDNFYHFIYGERKIVLSEELYRPIELVVQFTSANYSTPIYCPPEACC